MKTRVILGTVLAVTGLGILGRGQIRPARPAVAEPTPCFGYEFYAITFGKDIISVDQVRAFGESQRYDTCVEYGVPWPNRSLQFWIFARPNSLERAVSAVFDNDELNHFVLTPAYGNTMDSASIEYNKALGNPRQMIVASGFIDDVEVGRRLGQLAQVEYRALESEPTFHQRVGRVRVIRTALMERAVPSRNGTMALDAFFEVRKGRTERFQVMAGGTVYYCGYFDAFPDRSNS